MNKTEFKKELESIIYSIYPYSKIECFDEPALEYIAFTVKLFYKGNLYERDMRVDYFVLKDFPEVLIKGFLNNVQDDITRIILSENKEVSINEKFTE